MIETLTPSKATAELTVTIDGKPADIVPHTLSFTSIPEFVTIGPAPEADPDWVFIDPEGHEHRYDGDGKVPTTFRQWEKFECPYCDVVHEREWLSCRKCWETITPGIRMAPARRVHMGEKVEVAFDVIGGNWLRVLGFGPYAVEIIGSGMETENGDRNGRAKWEAKCLVASMSTTSGEDPVYGMVGELVRRPAEVVSDVTGPR